MDIKVMTIFYKNNIFNPMVRNVLKTVFLDKSKLCFMCTDEESSADIFELAKKIASHRGIAELLADTSLRERLQMIAGKNNDIEQSLPIIFGYLYSEEETDGNYVERWINLYGKRKSVQIKDNTIINDVNRAETKTYLKLFEKERKAEQDQITNATYSLIETIPCDVDSIVDIGCGPGLVNRFIPYYYDVIGVDIDEDILKQCERKTCLGDILDLPFADRTFDMAISSDVLEHVELEKVEQAVREMQRVAKKYIYIQVPNEEVLRYSLAKCPHCGNIWHVNFHKATYNLDKLRSFETNEWELCQVNYTGEVTNDDDSAEIYRQIEEQQIPVYRVENFECPVCGELCKAENVDLLTYMEKNGHNLEKGKRVKPHYTEIGVLFKRRGEYLLIDNAFENDEFVTEKISSNTIDFTKHYFQMHVYTGKEQIPVLIEPEMLHKQCGIGIVCSAEKGFLTLAFPFFVGGTVLEIKGEVVGETTIQIIGIDNDDNEFIEQSFLQEQGKFCLLVPLNNQKWFSRTGLIRVYYDKEITVSSVTCLRKEKRYGIFITPKGDKGIYKKRLEGIRYCFFIPKRGVVFEKEFFQEVSGEIKNNKVLERIRISAGINSDISCKHKVYFAVLERIRISAGINSAEQYRIKYNNALERIKVSIAVNNEKVTILCRGKEFIKQEIRQTGIYLLNYFPKAYMILRKLGIEQLAKKIAGKG